MVYFLALLPATVLTIAGYFVLFLSARSEGSLRTFGRYLGYWAFTLAGLVILGALFAAAHGGHRGYCPWHPHDLDSRYEAPRGSTAPAPPAAPGAPGAESETPTPPTRQ